MTLYKPSKLELWWSDTGRSRTLPAAFLFTDSSKTLQVRHCVALCHHPLSDPCLLFPLGFLLVVPAACFSRRWSSTIPPTPTPTPSPPLPTPTAARHCRCGLLGSMTPPLRDPCLLCALGCLLVVPAACFSPRWSSTTSPTPPPTPSSPPPQSLLHHPRLSSPSPPPTPNLHPTAQHTGLIYRQLSP
jgi:hypothetical protein